MMSLTHAINMRLEAMWLFIFHTFFFFSLFFSNRYLFLKILFNSGCAGSLLLRSLFSSCGKQGLLSSCSAQASRHGGFFHCRAQALGHAGLSSVLRGVWSTGSIVVAHGLSCSVACEIFLDQRLNPGLLLWQADSLPLSHQKSPLFSIPNKAYRMVGLK